MHQIKPDIYKDDNHKPELAVALSKFETLCGFRQISEIKHYLRSIPELCTVIGNSHVSNFFLSNNSNVQNTLKNCFTNLMVQENEIVDEQLKKFINRIAELGKVLNIFQVFMRLYFCIKLLCK